MLTEQREDHYAIVTRKRKLKKKDQRTGVLSYTRTRIRLTPKQQRRLNHKDGSRKTHDHDRSAIPEGQKFRCPRCMPLPYRQPEIKAAAGPRDWKPGGGSADAGS